MSKIARIISTLIEEGRRRIKVVVQGKKDTQTPYDAAPWGYDANPVSGIRAVYMPTDDKGTRVIVGFINLNQIAEVGESGLYSTDEDGAVSFRIRLRNNGTAEIGGDADFMVRYNELETAFNELKDDHNALVDRVNDILQEVGIFAAAYVPGGPAAVGLPPTFTFDNASEPTSDADITPAKIEEIKTR